MAEETKKSEEDLIAGYENAKAELKKAKRIIGSIIFVIVITNVLVMVTSTRNFAKNRTGEFALALTQNMKPVATNHLPQVQGIAKNLAPIYYKELNKMLRKEIPAIETRVRADLDELESFAISSWPSFQDEITMMFVHQENNILGRLEKLLGKRIEEGEAQRISNAYKVALTQRIEKSWQNLLTEHQKLVGDIGSNLEALTSTEPDLNRNVEIEEALGIMLELAGIELQSGITL